MTIASTVAAVGIFMIYQFEEDTEIKDTGNENKWKVCQNPIGLVVLHCGYNTLFRVDIC